MIDLENIVQGDVERALMHVGNKLDEQTEQVAAAAENAAKADVAHRSAWARAILNANAKTVEQRAAQATLATEQELDAKKVAEATLWAYQELGRNLRAQLEALRSVNSNLRGLVSERR